MSHQPARRACTLFVNSESKVLSDMLVLFRRKYDVLLAKCCSEAFEILKKHQVDVVVCEQHMPVMSGVDFLRKAAELQPSVMRLLLAAHDEMKSVVGSVSEDKLFHVIDRSCSRVEMTDLMARALEAAQAPENSTVKSVKADEQADNSKSYENGDGSGTINGNGLRVKQKQSGIMILDNDPDGRASLEKMLKGRFTDVHAAGSVAECTLHLLRNPNVGVFVTQANVQGRSVDSLLTLLKQYQPRLVTIIVTSRASAPEAIRMIDEGHAYRFLVEPLREGITKVYVTSAMRHHQELVKPSKRPIVILPPDKEFVLEHESPSILTRLRQLAFREDSDIGHHR